MNIQIYSASLCMCESAFTELGKYYMIIVFAAAELLEDLERALLHTASFLLQNGFLDLK